MANSIMMLRCKWCGAEIALAKGYYGALRCLVNANNVDILDAFIHAHGVRCDKCEYAVDESTEHFELHEFYS